MEILDYIKSKDIKKYLKDIKYECDQKAALWIAYQCDFITLEEKLSAFENIISTFPDENECYGDSIHEGIKKYIDWKRESIEDFVKNDGTCVYNAEIETEFHNSYSRILFNSYNEVFNYIKKELVEKKEEVKRYHGKISKICIVKRKINSDIEDRIFLNKKLEILDIRALRMHFDNENYEYAYRKVGYWLYDKNYEIPVPFKKGDILTLEEKPIWYKLPFVFDKICMQCMVEKEMTLCSDYFLPFGYCCNKINFDIDYVFPHNNYLDLVYYEGELPKEYNNLKLVSKILKVENGMAHW